MVEGASKTDVAAQLPALQPADGHLGRRGGAVRLEHLAPRLGAADHRGRALWAFVSLVIGTIVPVVYQQFFVQPNELQKETPVHRSATSTRRARRSALDQVAVQSFDYKQNLTAQSIQRQRRPRSTTRASGTRPSSCATTSCSRALQTFYKFADADVDRYVIDGKLRQTLIAARELNPADLPSQTLGEPAPRVHPRLRRGRVAEQLGRARTASPNYLLSDIPPRGRHPARPARGVLRREPRTASRSSTRSTQEFNYPKKGASNAFTRYTGSGGVELSSWLRRAAFALRFNDFNMLISGQVTPKTKVAVPARHHRSGEEGGTVPELRRATRTR